MAALGRHPKANVRREGGEEPTPPILQGKSINPFISKEILEKSRPIRFRTPSGVVASGYRADLLPDVKPADAIHAATALMLGVDAMQVWDRDFSKIASMITIEQPKRLTAQMPLIDIAKAIGPTPEDFASPSAHAAASTAPPPPASQSPGDEPQTTTVPEPARQIILPDDQEPQPPDSSPPAARRPPSDE